MASVSAICAPRRTSIRLLSQVAGALQEFHRLLRIALRQRHGAESTQRVGLTAWIRQLPARVVGRLECRLGFAPVAHAFGHATHVVLGDDLIAKQAGRALRLQGARIDLIRLIAVAHAVVGGGNAIQRIQCVQRQTHFVVEALRATQVREALGKIALQAVHVAAREQGAGQHLVVLLGGGSGHGLIVERQCVRVLALHLEPFPATGLQTRAQTRALQPVLQQLHGGNLLLERGHVPLAVILAEQQPGAEFEIDIRLGSQLLQCLLRQSSRLVGVPAQRHRGLCQHALYRDMAGVREARLRRAGTPRHRESTQSLR